MKSWQDPITQLKLQQHEYWQAADELADKLGKAEKVFDSNKNLAGQEHELAMQDLIGSCYWLVLVRWVGEVTVKLVCKILKCIFWTLLRECSMFILLLAYYASMLSVLCAEMQWFPPWLYSHCILSLTVFMHEVLKGLHWGDCERWGAHLVCQCSDWWKWSVGTMGVCASGTGDNVVGAPCLYCLVWLTQACTLVCLLKALDALNAYWLSIACSVL